MDPSEGHEIAGILEGKLFFFVGCGAGVGGSALLWDDEMSDREGVV